MEDNKRFIEAKKLGRKSDIWTRIANVSARISRLAAARADAYDYEQALTIGGIIEDYNARLMEIEQANIEKHRKEFKIEP
jgi:hypothetical protein